MDRIIISSAQVRAARGLLNWTQSKLADRCNLTKATIANIENEKHHLTAKTANKIHKAFENAKIEILGSNGIRSKVDDIRTLEGESGIFYLLNDVYNSVRMNGGIIKASGVDEDLLQRNLDKDYVKMHVSRMQKVKNLDFKVLISNEDVNTYARPYIKYKSVPSKYFFPLPVYIYDEKVAFIIFDPLKVLLIDNFSLFLMHSNQFDMMWEKFSNLIKEDK